MAYALPHRHEGQAATASGLEVLAGIWLLISPFVVGFAGVVSATTNNLVCGVVIIALAAINFMGTYRQAWLGWTNRLIGIWCLFSPWALGFAHDHHTATANNMVTGVVIAMLAFWSAMITSSETTAPGYRTEADRP